MKLAILRQRRLPLWLVAFAGVATVTAIVVEGELGLFEPGSTVDLWVGLAPGIAWLGAGIVAWALRPGSPGR